MKITKISESKKGSNTFNLYIDGSFALHISGETLFKLKLKENLELTEAGYENLRAVEDAQKALDNAWALVSIRQRSKEELKEKLEKKGYAPLSVQNAVEKLHGMNYIDDAKFAKSWVESRIRQGKGPFIIRFELKEKGISPEIIADVMNYDEDTLKLEFDALKTLALKKLEKLKTAPPREQAGKLMGYLASRGFTPEQIENALRDIKKDIEIP